MSATPSRTRDFMLSPQQTGSKRKVAIPRLQAAASPSATKRHRVDHACEVCKHRKIKCTGEKPKCKHCADFDLDCTYASTQRERLKSDYSRTKDVNAELFRYLRGLSKRVGAPDREEIRKLLELDADDRSSITAPSSTTTPSVKRVRFNTESTEPAEEESEAAEEDDRGEDEVGAEVGSNESPDMLDQNLDKNPGTKAIGFIGKNSDVQWFRRLKQQVDQGGDDEDARANAPYGPPGTSKNASSRRDQLKDERHPQPLAEASAATYHADLDSVWVEDLVDPFELPPLEIARELFTSYLDTVHSAFPIIERDNVNREFNKVYGKEPYRLPHKYRAILNLVFAIGAKHAHLIGEPQGDPRDHAVYFTRARMIGMNGDALFQHPDNQQVQICALLGFYLMSIGQVNRAWIITALASRYAFALGLHVRNKDRGMSSEMTVRIWWSVYSLERQLCVMNGRPSCIRDDNCSTPLPLPIDEKTMASERGEELMQRLNNGHSPGDGWPSKSASNGRTKETDPQHSPNTGLYFRLRVQLAIITHEAMTQLYAAGIVMKSWEHVQGNIDDLDKRLDEWLGTLPMQFNFTKTHDNTRYFRERLTLGFFYYSARILVTRPCLCRVDRRIEHQTSSSKSFNREKAQACVHAAQGMVALLPDSPDAIVLYKTGPWWCQMHLLMQASTVLMLELVYQSCHMPQEAHIIVRTMKKLVSWLRNMAEDNATAQRAWKMSVDLLHKVAPIVHADVSDVSLDEPFSPSVPVGVPELPPTITHQPAQRQSVGLAATSRALPTQFHGASQALDGEASNQAPHTPGHSTSLPLQQQSGPTLVPQETANLALAALPVQQQQLFDPSVFFGEASLAQGYYGISQPAISQPDPGFFGVPMYTTYDQFGVFSQAVMEPQTPATLFGGVWPQSAMDVDEEEGKDL